MIKNVDDFRIALIDKFGIDNFKILKFTSMRSECSIECLKCGKIQNLTRAENFTRKNRKFLCDHKLLKNNEKELTFEERRRENFCNRIKNRYPNENLAILHFTKQDEQATIMCNTCNSIYTMTGSSFLNVNKKRICKKCFPTNKTTEIGHKVEYLLKNNDSLELLNTYTKITDNLKLKCKKCQGKFLRMPQVFLQSQKCPYCETHSKKRTTDIFNYELKKAYNDEYTLVEEYINTNTKILVRHNDCGFIFKISPHDLMRNAPCPKCKKFNSKGEIKINKILTSHNIYFVPQQRFADLPLLSFDFYLPNHNILIEFQGEQHYIPIKHFGGEEKFLKQQNNDNKKREYCKVHKFKLLEIKYDDIDNIEEILSFLWIND